MNRKEAIRQTEQIRRLEALGFSQDEAETLRRISMTLSRWSERECNGEVKVDGDGKAYSVSQGYPPAWKVTRYRIPNREAGAIRRAGMMMQDHPGWNFFHQTDPRGAALYLYRHEDVRRGIDCDYSSIGICVY